LKESNLDYFSRTIGAGITHWSLIDVLRSTP
jgi:hypothetical protein